MTMPEKTIKVDEAVHQRLKELKQHYGVETFNEVLRHELDIVSDPKLVELAAYLDESLQNTVSDVISVIRELDEFEEQVKENGSEEVLEFVTPETNRVIASVTFRENSFQVKYRSQSGEMSDCGRGYQSTRSDSPKYGRRGNTHPQTEAEDVVEQVESKVTGAYRRWGN